MGGFAEAAVHRFVEMQMSQFDDFLDVIHLQCKQGNERDAHQYGEYRYCGFLHAIVRFVFQSNEKSFT